MKCGWCGKRIGVNRHRYEVVMETPQFNGEPRVERFVVCSHACSTELARAKLAVVRDGKATVGKEASDE